MLCLYYYCCYYCSLLHSAVVVSVITITKVTTKDTVQHVLVDLSFQRARRCTRGNCSKIPALSQLFYLQIFLIVVIKGPGVCRVPTIALRIVLCNLHNDIVICQAYVFLLESAKWRIFESKFLKKYLWKDTFPLPASYNFILLQSYRFGYYVPALQYFRILQ